MSAATLREAIIDELRAVQPAAPGRVYVPPAGQGWVVADGGAFAHSKAMAEAYANAIHAYYGTTFQWQVPVIERWDASGGLPSGPSTGDRYLCSVSGNGWTIHHIYEWSGAAWVDTAPLSGMMVWVDDEDLVYLYTGTAWQPLSSAIEMALDDLTDVTITSPTLNHVLVYDDCAFLWKNAVLNHSQLGGVSADQHHARQHNLTSGDDHVVSGLTAGHFLKATGAASFAFGPHGLTYSDVGAAAAGHNHDSDYDPLGSAAAAMAGHVAAYDHSLLHAAATVTGNGIAINGQQINLDIGTGAAQVAAGNHAHAGTYQPLDDDLTSLAGLNAVAGDIGKAVVVSGANTYTLGQDIRNTATVRFGALGLGADAGSILLRAVGTQSVDGALRVTAYMMDSAAIAAGVGAGLGFGGKWTAAGGYACWAGVQGLKDNANADDLAGGLQLLTRANGGSLAVALTLASTLAAVFAGTLRGVRFGAGADPDTYAVYYGTTSQASAPAAWLNQSSTGDAYTRYSLATTRSYAWGIDNSDSDKMVLSTVASGAAAPGTSNLAAWDTSGNLVNAGTVQATLLGLGVAPVANLLVTAEGGYGAMRLSVDNAEICTYVQGGTACRSFNSNCYYDGFDWRFGRGSSSSGAIYCATLNMTSTTTALTSNFWRWESSNAGGDADAVATMVTRMALTGTGVLKIDHIAELTGSAGIAMDHAVTCASTLQALRAGFGVTPDSTIPLLVEKDTGGTYSSATVAAIFGDVDSSDNVYIIGNTIGTGYGFDADDYDVHVNYRGYAGGVTRFRSFTVDDGKGAAILNITGSTKASTFSGTLRTTGLGVGLAPVAGAIALTEIAAPAASAANNATLFVCDNGAGKTSLRVRFQNSIYTIGTDV